MVAPTPQALENRTLDSRREMDILNALDEMKSLKVRLSFELKKCVKVPAAPACAASAMRCARQPLRRGLPVSLVRPACLWVAG